MLHQPDPEKKEDMLKGIIDNPGTAYESGKRKPDLPVQMKCSTRRITDICLICLSYVAVGARSVEDQQHRLTASGVGIPVGMKNPTGGDISGYDEFHDRCTASDIRFYTGAGK